MAKASRALVKAQKENAHLAAQLAAAWGENERLKKDAEANRVIHDLTLKDFELARSQADNFAEISGRRANEITRLTALVDLLLAAGAKLPAPAPLIGPR